MSEERLKRQDLWGQGDPETEVETMAGKENDNGDSIINHSYVRRLLSTESTQSNGDDHLTRYGWGTFRPQILQCLSGVKGLLFLISFYVIAQGLIVGGLVNTSLSTIERRYRLSSSQLGLIVTSNDIITSCILFIITYLVRSRRAKIKFLSAGALILTTGAIIWILPHFMVGLYNYGALVEKACDPAGDGAGSECDDGQRGLSSYMFMFIAAQVFFGTSSIPLYTFGSDLIEGTAPPNAGGFYLAAMTGDCMKNCNCPLAYEPVCGTGGVEFFSPCYAGCRTEPVGDSEEYGSCGCVTHDTTIPVTTPHNFTTVTPGHCASDCKILPFVLAMLTYYAVASAMWGPALTFVALRCVPEDQRSVGLGFQGVIRKLLANIPCPMLFGAFLDKACLMWEESCDERGACLIYDNSKLGLYFFILTFIFSCWAVLGLFGALISWNRHKYFNRDLYVSYALHMNNDGVSIFAEHNAQVQMIADRQLIQELKHAAAEKLRDPNDAMKQLTPLKENWTLLEDVPEDDNNNNVDYRRFGWWGFRPRCLQFLSGVNGMLLLLFLFIFAQGSIVNGLVNTSISSIEKRYNLSSSKTGTVSIGYDIGNGALGLLVTYWIRTRRAKVKALSLGALLLPDGGPSDSRWLGAWWLGFPMFATIALLISPWLAGLPGKYPDNATLSTGAKKGKEDPENKGLVNFFKEMASMFKIPTLLFLTSASCGIAMSFNGLITFAVKYVENQFAQPAGWSAILSGIVLIPGGMGGSLLGGFMMRRLRVGISGALKLAITGSIVMGITSAGFLLRPAPVPPIVGAQEMTSSCNLNCNCQTKYDPVCAPSGVEFFSPCIAGCMEQLPGESKLQSYGMCSCLPTNQSAASGSPDVENKVTSGHCPNNCDLLPVVLCALFVYAVGMASMGPAMLFSTLRCVQESRRSLALGFQSLIARFLGAIPGPIVYGSLIDRACLLWNETCDQKGACLVYDNANLSTYFFTVTFALACWIFLSLCLALYSWKRSEANSKLIDEKNAELDNDARKRVSGILELVYYRETTV
uniref:Kazal-like domain-containing protein n=1 Tax=Branchiostoma floridae TaxID=7739 RepID=C3ZHR0_BRAFL|eukprot:XP_002592044.1 hypothetical protein BRAFLDRAFT_79633 [Branchiostoma floridae]